MHDESPHKEGEGMRKAFVVSGLILLSLSGVAFADESIQGYQRKDGTYVQPYHRSQPDGNPYNNYGYPGNTNPYTGQTAPGNPDSYLQRQQQQQQDRSLDLYRGLYGR